MAGERFRLGAARFVELSAICTRPEARGRGLAAALTHHLARRALTAVRSLSSTSFRQCGGVRPLPASRLSPPDDALRRVAPAAKPGEAVMDGSDRQHAAARRFPLFFGWKVVGAAFFVAVFAWDSAFTGRRSSSPRCTNRVAGRWR